MLRIWGGAKKHGNWITSVSDVTFQVFFKTDPMPIKITQLRPAPGHLNNEIQPAAAPQCTSNQEKTRWLRVLLHLIELYDNESPHISFLLQEKQWLCYNKYSKVISAVKNKGWMISKGLSVSVFRTLTHSPVAKQWGWAPSWAGNMPAAELWSYRGRFQHFLQTRWSVCF